MIIIPFFYAVFSTSNKMKRKQKNMGMKGEKEKCKKNGNPKETAQNKKEEKGLRKKMKKQWQKRKKNN
jgi:predicted solute-binding protein